jgi:hypothetical protein
MIVHPAIDFGCRQAEPFVKAASEAHGMSKKKMKLMKSGLAAALVAIWSIGADAAFLTAEQAASHIGESATVCGLVASAHYAATTHAQPTFLNLGQSYPNQIFTAVIFGNDRAKFGAPESTLVGKGVCVKGPIQLYRGKPEIILHDANQLTPQ